MEAAQAKPILEGVQGPNAKKKKPGSWLRVHGKVTVNRYDGELVIEPFGIMKGKRPNGRTRPPSNGWSCIYIRTCPPWTP